MAKNNCLSCSNKVGPDFCTMNKDMNKAQFKKCDGHKVLPPKPVKIISSPKKRSYVVGDDDEYLPEFIRFIRKGGSWSFRTGKSLT